MNAPTNLIEECRSLTTNQPDKQELFAATKGREHFSTILPGLQVAWDSTSLGDFKLCPRKYYYTHILGLKSRREAMPLIFGSFFHSGLEQFQRFRFEGMDHEEALHAVVPWLLDKMGHRQPDPLNEDGSPVLDADGSPVRGEWIGPWISDDSKRNRETCLRAVVWHIEHHKDDILQTLMLANGKPAVELSFRFEAPVPPAPTGETILLSGHMDRVTHFEGFGSFVLDHKTTVGQLDNRYFDGYSPDNQMSLYTIAAKVVFHFPVKGVIIDGIGLAVNFTTFQRGFVYRTEAHCEEWLEDLSIWTKLSGVYAEMGHWPMNDKACSMYGGCPFRQTCSKSPATRHTYLNASFERRPWDPLVKR